MPGISEYEKFILDRHAVYLQTWAVWWGVSTALIFSYTGAYFAFLISESLGVRLAAFIVFSIAYWGMAAGIGIVGAAMLDHTNELQKIQDSNSISGLGRSTLQRSKLFTWLGRGFGAAAVFGFYLGLVALTFVEWSDLKATLN